LQLANWQLPTSDNSDLDVAEVVALPLLLFLPPLWQWRSAVSRQDRYRSLA
jgi:hypothetical protein